jgi:hypothetical protein
MQKEKEFNFFKSSVINAEEIKDPEVLRELKLAEMKYQHKMKIRSLGVILMIASLVGLYFKVEYSGWVMFAGFFMLDIF